VSPRKSRVRWGAWLVAAAGFVLLALAATAQQTTALCGVVTDVSGAVIPGATVMAKAPGGHEVHAVADGEGTFRFAALTPGEYTIAASAQGFAPTEQTVTVGTQAEEVRIALNVGQTIFAGVWERELAEDDWELAR